MSRMFWTKCSGASASESDVTSRGSNAVHTGFWFGQSFASYRQHVHSALSGLFHVSRESMSCFNNLDVQLDVCDSRETCVASAA